MHCGIVKYAANREEGCFYPFERVEKEMFNMCCIVLNDMASKIKPAIRDSKNQSS